MADLALVADSRQQTSAKLLRVLEHTTHVVPKSQESNRQLITLMLMPFELWQSHVIRKSFDELIPTHPKADCTRFPHVDRELAPHPWYIKVTLNFRHNKTWRFAPLCTPDLLI